MNKKIKIAYILNEDKELGGSSLSLYNLLNAVKNEVEPILIIKDYGEVYDFFANKGYTCMVYPFRLNFISGKGWKKYLTYIPRVFYNRYLCYKAEVNISKILQDKGIDIIHTNSSVVDIGIGIARRLGIPHIWHIREFIDLGLGIHPIWGYDNWKEKVLSSSAVIAISKSLYSHLGEDYSNLYYIPDAVAKAADFENSIDEEVVKEKYFLFLSGRIHSIKSPEMAIESFLLSELWKKGYKLKIVGRCSQEYRRELLVQGGESSKSIVFQDFTDNVAGVMKKAQAFLMCSKHEGLGRVLIEAMFYNCVVIALNSGPSADIIDNGENGWLYNYSKECADIMNKVVETDNKEMLAKAKKAAIENFSEEVFKDNILDIYSRFI